MVDLGPLNMLSYFYSVSYRKEEGGRSKLLADRARPLITFLPAPSSGQHQPLAGHRQLKAARAALVVLVALGALQNFSATLDRGLRPLPSALAQGRASHHRYSKALVRFAAPWSGLPVPVMLEVVLVEPAGCPEMPTRAHLHTLGQGMLLQHQRQGHPVGTCSASDPQEGSCCFQTPLSDRMAQTPHTARQLHNSPKPSPASPSSRDGCFYLTIALVKGTGSGGEIMVSSGEKLLSSCWQKASPFLWDDVCAAAPGKAPHGH